MVAIKRKSSDINTKLSSRKNKNTRVFKENNVAESLIDGNLANNSTKGSESAHQMQKLLRLQRKAAKTPAFELIQELKKLWEQLRMKSISKDNRKEVVKQTMKIVKGHIKEVIFKHDSSRIIQSLLKYSNVKDQEFGRPAVLEELYGNFVELSKSPYGRFVVLKALKYAPNSQYRSKIISEFFSPGIILKLIKHSYADVVIDTIYCIYANAKERQLMVEQFYGMEYQLIRSNMQNVPPCAAFKTALEQNIDKKPRIMEQMKENMVNIIMKEGTAGRNEIVHRVIYDYVSNLTFDELVSTISSDTAPLFPLISQIPSILHTKFGSQISIILLSASGAKERKSILKNLKPHVNSIAKNEYGWQVLCRAFDAVDDTVLTKNCISSEIFDSDHGNSMFSNKNSRKLMLYLLNGKDTKIFSPDLIGKLSTASDFLLKTSKKDESQRKQEILSYIFPKMKSLIVSLEILDELVRDKEGGLLISSILKHCTNSEDEKFVETVANFLQQLCTQEIVWPIEVKLAVVGKDGNQSDESDDEESGNLKVNKDYLDSEPKLEQKVNILLDKNGSRLIRRLCMENSTVSSSIKSIFIESFLESLTTFIKRHTDFPAGPFFVASALVQKEGREGDIINIFRKFKSEISGVSNPGVKALEKYL